MLRALAGDNDVPTVYIDLYRLAIKTLTLLGTRTDRGDLWDDYSPLVLSDDMKSAVNLVVGKNYSSIDWYEIDLAPDEEDAYQEFRWGDDDFLFPYFVVTRGDHKYTSLTMGHGELCVHILFWILNHHRDIKNLTILLDEPDAFLPPVGISSLLQHLLYLCHSNHWKLILSTHSEEMIKQARLHEGFVLLRSDNKGVVSAINSKDEPTAGDSLLPAPPSEIVIFCEDESGQALIRGILNTHEPGLSRQITVIWGSGSGDLVALQRALPRPPDPDIRFAFVHDGDKRGSKDVPASAVDEWPTIFLPTRRDPDELFMSLADSTDDLVIALGAASRQALEEQIESLAGEDVHDWVNKLGDIYGRQQVLTRLAALWSANNTDECNKFVEELKQGIGLAITNLGWLRHAFEQTKKDLGRSNRLTLKLQADYADEMIRHGNANEALAILENAIQSAKEDELVIDFYRLKGSALAGLGDERLASRAFRKAHDLAAEVFGPTDQRTLVLRLEDVPKTDLEKVPSADLDA
ncbi:M48 family metallopeptidase [Mycobacterium sp. GA-1841]|uniref:tetratricopeptide repeat protein n=1 Tax=Mycobacterium sp. GA-1841 TaxID=1834154 RepID=UPI001115531E|nr:hypothetical protein [Mycobacterium sp. GA-1841]